MFNIQQILGTQIDWHAYVSATNNLLGRSPTRSLDTYGMAAGSVISFIGSIGEFEVPGTNPWQYVAEADYQLELIQLGFLVWSDSKDEMDYLIRYTCLHKVITIDETVIILVGNVRVWRDEVVHFMRPGFPKPVREFYTGMHRFMCSKLGMDTIFKSYDRIKQSDGTIALEYKPH